MQEHNSGFTSVVFLLFLFSQAGNLFYLLLECLCNHNNNKNAVDADRKEAFDMRNVAMERFRETLKRKVGDDDSDSETTSKRSRRSSLDTLSFMREKLEIDKEHRIGQGRKTSTENGISAVFSNVPNSDRQSATAAKHDTTADDCNVATANFFAENTCGKKLRLAT